MRFSCALALFLTMSSHAAMAAELPVDSKISTVTVFPNGAEVTRILKVKLSAGDSTLLAGDIPGEAISKSIRIEIAPDAKIEIGSVDARQIKLSSTDPEVALSARKKIEDQIQVQQDLLRAQDDIVKVAQLQQTYLTNLANLPQSNGQGASGMQGAQPDWRSLFGIIGDSAAEVAKTIAAAELKQREIKRAIADLHKQMEAVSGKAEERTQVRIHVSAAAAVETTLTLRYQVRTASWTAFYDARLSAPGSDKSAASSMVLTRRASIQQKTGEDWDDVALSLSTTRPGATTVAPKMRTLIAVFDPTADSRAGESGLDIGDSETSGKTKTQASVTAFQTIHTIPGRVTIKHSDEAKRLQIGGETVQPTLVVRTTPRLDDTAYLYTHFTLPKTSPALQPGQVSLFRDGVFVGTGQFPLVAPGEDYDLGFGADERVKVRRSVLDIKKGETGTFSKSYVDQRRYAISFKNLHPHAVDVQVVDRAPVAVHSDIKVEFTMDSGPQPTVKNLDDRHGVYMWQLKAQPDEDKTIAFSYRVTVPAGKRVLLRDLTNEDMQGMSGLK